MTPIFDYNEKGISASLFGLVCSQKWLYVYTHGGECFISKQCFCSAVYHMAALLTHQVKCY